MAESVIQKDFSATSSVSDLNSCDALGFYMFDASTNNRPSSYGICFTISTSKPKDIGDGWVFQMAFDTGTAQKIYLRQRINNGSWTNWTSITLT